MLNQIKETLHLEYRNNVIHESLDKIETTLDVVRFLNDFCTFNGAFAGGVACCAGNIHRAMNMFTDKDELIHRCSDRSSAIASRVFFAAEDEYNNGREDRSTHREMAQKFIRRLADITNITPEQHNELYKETHEFNNIISDIFSGYGAYYGEDITVNDIMLSLGFHIASELSADSEFNIVYKWLKDKHPNILQQLKEDNSHMWIKVHCTVEIEHFESALDGVKLAIKYYSGPENENQLVNMFLDGINKFSFIHNMFYKYYVTNSLK